MSGPGRWLAWTLWAAASAATRSLAQQPLVVDVEPLPARVFVQQEFEIVLRLGVDRRWLAERAVPLLQQRLDRPFHVVVPWLVEDERHSVTPTVAPDAGVRVAVGDRVLAFRAVGERVVDGQPFDWLELRCRAAALQPGAWVLPPVQVRYAFGTRFQDDFLRGRQPLDRQEATAHGPERTVSVEALPPGAPADHFGAVGSFELQLTAPATATVGEPCAGTLVLGGQGNFARLPAPTSWRLPGFHVQGVTVARSATGCRFELDLLPLREGTELGPVSLTAFEPTAARYVDVTAAAVPMRVGPNVAPERLPPRVQELIAAEAARTASPWVLWGWLAVVPVGLVLTRVWSRRRAQHQRDRDARTMLARAAASLPHEPAVALAAFDACLALRAGLAGFAPDGDWAALQARGVAGDLVGEVRELRARLDAARYGGIAPTGDTVRAALERLWA